MTFVLEINISDLAPRRRRATRSSRASRRHAAAAQRITPVQREELDGLLGELKQASENTISAALMELDTRVHRFVYRCAANPYLEQTLDRYFNLSLRIWYLVLDRLPHLAARVHEHDDLLGAIREGEAERARAIVAEHIETFERGIRAAL